MKDFKYLHVLNSYLLNGAYTKFLNSGALPCVVLEEVSTLPSIVLDLALIDVNPNTDITVKVICGHEDTSETLDVDCIYRIINEGDNLDTKANATLNETPTTPGTAYERFDIDYTIPSTAFDANSCLNIVIQRDNSGADTGDLYVYQLWVYQGELL